MKIKSIKYVALIVLGLSVMFFSCEKKYTTDNITQKIVAPHYPTITLNGPQFMSVPVSASGTYTDAGAVGLNDNDNSTVQLTPEPYDVDLTTPGFYTVLYSFKNTDGYSADATRFILVTDVDGNLDYSGVYYRTANNSPMNVTKIGAGLYKTDNVGGVSGIPDYIFDVYFGQIDDTTLVVPNQPGNFGTIFCVNSYIYPTSADTTIQWGVRSAGFGTATRVFVKDEG